MKQMKTEEQAKWLTALLDLKRRPISIRFLLAHEDYTACRRPESRAAMPYCTAVRNAADGRSCKMKLEHFACLSAARALGMLPPGDDQISGKHHERMGVYEDLGVSRSIASSMVMCQHRCTGVEIAPLGEPDTAPDVLLLVAEPYTIMRISQGLAYHNGHLKNLQLAGMCAICQECTSYVFEKDQPNVSMLCSGTRCVAQWGKEEMAMGIPGRKLFQLISGLQSTLNPMENDTDKKRIAAGLAAIGWQDKLEITYSSNYYKGGYGTLQQLALRKNVSPK